MLHQEPNTVADQAPADDGFSLASAVTPPCTVSSPKATIDASEAAILQRDCLLMKPDFYRAGIYEAMRVHTLELFQRDTLPWIADRQYRSFMLNFDAHFGGIEPSEAFKEHRELVREMMKAYQDSELFRVAHPDWELDLTPGHELYEVTISFPGWEGTPMHFDDIGFHDQVNFPKGSLMGEFWRHRAVNVLYYMRYGDPDDGANLVFASTATKAERTTDEADSAGSTTSSRKIHAQKTTCSFPGLDGMVTLPGDLVTVPGNGLAIFNGGRGNRFPESSYKGRAHLVTPMPEGGENSERRNNIRIALSLFYRFQRTGEQLPHPREMASL